MIEKLNGVWILFTENKIIKNLVKVWNRYSHIYDKLMRTPLFKNSSKIFLESLPSCPGGVIHDGGVGTGYWLNSIREKTQARKIIGTDISEKMISRAKKKVDEMKLKNQEIQLKVADLTNLEEWPKVMFDLQCFQLVLNYLPNHQWKKVVRMAIETTKPGGEIYYSLLLKGFNVKELAKEHIVEQMRGTPFTSFPAMILSVVIMHPIDKLVEEGKIVPPTKSEFLDFHEANGCKVEIIEKIFWGAGIVVRARKM